MPRDDRPTARDAILPLVLDDVGYAVDGKRLVDGISLVLEPGPKTVVLGFNGAGKSLLLRLCHGLIRPTAGRVAWAGPGGAKAARHQAMVFQRPVLLRRSVRANLAYPLKHRGLDRVQRAGIVERMLDVAGLADIADRPARVLSGGQQQRLALARAWGLAPQVLFLDEPTASLDPAATKAVEAMIGRIHQAGTKIVMTTHDIGQARRLADEIVFLHRGRLVEAGPAGPFFDQPRTEPAQAFVEGRLA